MPPSGVLPALLFLLSSLSAAVSVQERPDGGPDGGPNGGPDGGLNGGPDGGPDGGTSGLARDARLDVEALLTTDSCGEGKWRVLSRDGETAVCVPRCPDYTAQWDGRCVSIEEMDVTRPCPSGMEWVNNLYGEAECECQSGKVFHEKSGQCGLPYLAGGVCGQGENLQMVSSPGDGGKFDCSPSLCEGDAVAFSALEQVHPWSVSQHPNYTCYDYSPRYSIGGPCPGRETMSVGPDMSLYCLDVSNLVLLNVNGLRPQRECDKGKRKFMYMCRKVTYLRGWRTRRPGMRRKSLFKYEA